MLTRKASKALLFLLIFIACSSFVLQPVDAQEGDSEGAIGSQALIINKDWVDTSVIEFDGHALEYTGKYNRLTIEHGAHGMINYVNHGEVAYDKLSDIHVYQADMIFKHTYLIWLDCMIDDVYPEHSTDTHEREWLVLTTFKNYANYKLGWEKGNIQRYYASYSGISIPNVDTQEYDGNLRIMMKVHPDLPIQEGDLIYINGMAFKVPDIRIFLSQTKVVDRAYGVVDPGTQNFYTENEGLDIVRKENLENPDNTPKHSDEAKAQCGDDGAVNRDEENTGWTPKEVISWGGIHDRVPYYGVTYTSGQIGQGFASAPTPGATWSRTEDLSDLDEEFIYDVPIRIKPNIFYDLEKFDLRKAAMKVDTYKEDWPYTEYGLCELKDMETESKSRIIGLGVQNIFIRIDFETSVTMLMQIQPTSEEGVDILEDPEIYQSDIIWDNAIGGTTDVEVPISEGPQTWGTDLLDSWNKFWADTGQWWNDQIDWWKDGIDDAWDNWFDWWKNWSPETLMNWWQKFWWIIILIAIVVVGIIGFYIFYPRIARGTARGITEYRQGQIENQQKPT